LDWIWIGVKLEYGIETRGWDMVEGQDVHTSMDMDIEDTFKQVTDSHMADIDTDGIQMEKEPSKEGEWSGVERSGMYRERSIHTVGKLTLRKKKDMGMGRDRWIEMDVDDISSQGQVDRFS
jgi:hypothetical protein